MKYPELRGRIEASKVGGKKKLRRKLKAYVRKSKAGVDAAARNTKSSY